MASIAFDPSLLLLLAIIVLVILLWRKIPQSDPAQLQQQNHALMQAIREEFRLGREESNQSAKQLREEVALSQNNFLTGTTQRMGEMAAQQAQQLTTFEKRIQALEASNIAHFETMRTTLEQQLKSIQQNNETRLEQMRTTVDEKLQSFEKSNMVNFESVRTTLEKQLTTLQQNNEKKLDQMRETVDEKLQSTLEKRLGESFKLVSDRLESVQQGLGEMKNLATGVGDLKRVLTNVKTRGTWGEFQLGAILDQILTPEQYGANVKVKHHSNDHVEFAIKLPGASDEPNSQVWLPIDSKFPHEDYARLVNASEIADPEAAKKALSALLRAIKESAKDIAGKYIDPPHTTDFAILFLPTEGLYAEVLREAGFVESIQSEFRVVITGPTTLSATLNSLRMGFRTLAIEKRSSEVWQVLSAVKTEFGKFGGVLEKVKKQLDTASRSIEETGTRTRVMSRKLANVESMDDAQSQTLLGIDAPHLNNNDEE
ncbi:MAG: DNA recombination protein RmuC [Zetaproteobacteria bacterium]|nr:DNA recombination protein RmuC [Zetaproteobacteria bacterium]